jgi:hypothetical protein
MRTANKTVAQQQQKQYDETVVAQQQQKQLGRLLK